MINIVGLGATDKYGLTLEAIEIIKNGNENYIRTKEHDAVEYFFENNIKFKSFDYLYDKNSSFEQVYDDIVYLLLEKSKEKDINYFVPGNPLVAEKTVVKLMEKTNEYKIISGTSFIEPVLRAIKRDPAKGFLLLDGDDFNILDINVKCDVIVTQVYNKRIIVDLKLSLSEVYGDEYKIYLLTDAGLKTEDVYYLPIYDLDKVSNINHQTALYIPACQDIKNLKDIISYIKDQELDKTNKSNECDENQIVNKSCEVLRDFVKLDSLGLYYIYDILEEIYKNLSKNSHFNKISMEKKDLIGYNNNSLVGHCNKTIIDRLESINDSSVNRASKVIDEVVSIGFVWDDIEGVFNKMAEEISELKVALNEESSDHVFEEVGDLMFTCINLCRFLKINPSDSLNFTIDKFIKRFSLMHEFSLAKSKNLEEMNIEELDDLYNRAKAILKSKKK